MVTDPSVQPEHGPAPSSGGPLAPGHRPAAPSSRPPRPGRAAPLPQDERRATIVAAALPLLREHGHDVTTRQIAAAACVAEGTIFRAFADKRELIDEAVRTALDPQPVLDALARIDPAAPLPDRVRAIVDILQDRLAGVIRLMVALRMPRPPSDQHQHQHQDQDQAHDAMLPAVERLLARDADLLRMPPKDAARMIRLFVFAGTHPGITDRSPLTGEQVADVLLHGIANPAATSPDPGLPSVEQATDIAWDDIASGVP